MNRAASAAIAAPTSTIKNTWTTCRMKIENFGPYWRSQRHRYGHRREDPREEIEEHQQRSIHGSPIPSNAAEVGCNKWHSARLRLVMKRSSFLASSAGSAAMLSMTRFAGAAEGDVVLVTPTGKLYGTLIIPQIIASPLRVVVLHPGSGPTDRDGNSPQFGIKPNTLELLAEALAGRGIASLRYDKRGIGKSAEAMASIGENDLRFDTYVDDALGWIAQLRDDSRFEGGVYFAGNSEGALIGILAAQRTRLDGFASLDGAGRSLLAVLRVQLAKLPPELHARATVIMDALAAGKTDDGPIPPELAAVFRPSVQPFLISEARYDPAVEIAKLMLPTLIVQGTADVQIPVTDGARLHKAAPKATYLLVEGMNHVLKIAPDVSTPAAIQAGYTDPTLPIAPEVVAALTALAMS